MKGAAIVLAAFVGSWNIRVRYWPQPGAPVQEGDGTAEIRWVLNGRYIEQRQETRLPGGPSSGIGYVGFDEGEGRYVSIWLDGLGVLHTSGAPDLSGKSVRTRGRMGRLDIEERMTPAGPGRFLYEAWTSRSDGEGRRRVMAIVYTRRR
ncbi:MAG TPA: DUF1579 family protein [Elusimicrobiota bacterium]|jgi:hypothetical protein|nr:DUF1579 family protein [Elusimicrobiota bacterium]